MNRHGIAAVVCTLLLFGGSLLGQQQANPPVPPARQGGPAGPPAGGRGRGGPPPPMSFFVTSVGIGRGGNLGGLAGADAQCQSLAAGRGNVTWHAYLSTQGPNAVNARDRIGNGPCTHNQRGQIIANSVAELHGDTLEQAPHGPIHRCCKLT